MRIVVVAAVAIFAIGAADVCGQLPRIRLNTVSPPGGQAGAIVTVTVNGDLTAAATELIFSHSGIEATQQIEAPSEYRAARRKQRVFDVRIGEGVPNGRYEVRALGPAGLSNPRFFCVSRLLEKRFESGANARTKPFDLSIGEVANATARADQRDYYKFTARRGQSLLVQVVAERIDSRLDASLAVYDAASGKRLGRSVQGMTRDPMMTFVPPADGDYLVEVWDSTFRGGEDYFYRLEVSERAQVEGVFPPVAKVGVESEFTVYGFNLPGGTATSSQRTLHRLQALKLRFTPEFSSPHPFATGLANGVVAGAMIDAASIELPVPLSGGAKVFIERTSHDVIVEQDGNNEKTQAQKVPAPGVVAGQFYPRRDVDWYEFEAKNKQSYWIEVASHQLGTSCDPVLQIVKRSMKGDQVEFSSVAAADDLEGPPGNRDARRMYSGTGDCGLHFRADADATYLVGVRDQYNVADDDPRLVYRLSIEPRRPDFQLIAFADPERHADDKVAKPNGVSLFAGGATIIRVRLLPRHGFNQPVHVWAENLPTGVTAKPITLHSRLKEGFLVLTASADAKPDLREIAIHGRTMTSEPLQRLARTATVRHTANNLDSELTQGRLSQNLLVAVVDSIKPAATLGLPADEVSTSIGGTFKLPVALARKKGFAAEVELVALQVPRGIKVNKVKTKEQRAELSVEIADANLPPGRYTFPVAAKVKEKRPKNTVAVGEADQDLKKVLALLAKRTTELAAEEAKFAELDKVSAKVSAQVKAAQTQAAEPKRQLSEKLAEQRRTAATLAEKLAASLADVSDEALLKEVTSLESELEKLKQHRQKLEQEWRVVSKSLAAVTQAAEQQLAAKAKAHERLEAVRAKKAEAEKQKGEAEKRLNDVKKSEMEQDAEFWVYSPPVQLDVAKSPLSIRLGKQHQIAQGGTLRLPVVIERRFGFDGQILVKPSLADDCGIVAAPFVLGAGQNVAALVLTASDESKVGRYAAKLDFKLKFNKAEITDSAACQVEVVAKK